MIERTFPLLLHVCHFYLKEEVGIEGINMYCINSSFTSINIFLFYRRSLLNGDEFPTKADEFLKISLGLTHLQQLILGMNPSSKCKNKALQLHF